jgi:hypothetical protein
MTYLKPVELIYFWTERYALIRMADTGLLRFVSSDFQVAMHSCVEFRKLIVRPNANGRCLLEHGLE